MVFKDLGVSCGDSAGTGLVSVEYTQIFDVVVVEFAKVVPDGRI